MTNGVGKVIIKHVSNEMNVGGVVKRYEYNYSVGGVLIRHEYSHL